MTIKTQIYLNTPTDAMMACQAGANFIGIVCDGASLMPQSLSYPDAQALFNAVPEGRMRVSLTISPQPEQILDMIRNIQPDVIHLAATNPLSVDQILTIRLAAPKVKIMQTIAVNLGNPFQFARSYQPVSDYFLLDTADPNDAAIGATGIPHDWNLSANIVKAANIPVFLAGGLTPENVKEAIRIVRPWGVDSYSQTNIEDKPHRKDPDKVNTFILNAQGTLHAN
ncbi:MAG: phosphoribosylanthranilate isomerase [Anaerolineaceae bacterium]|nr:phosphoribosylanthranilate isomerase [Anaerolineaceae bacterium]